MEKNTREDVAKLPEQEAAEVLKKLRRKAPRIPLSVYALVDKKNRRLIHVAADNPADYLNDHMDAYYNADSGVDKIVAAAIKKMHAQFATQ